MQKYLFERLLFSKGGGNFWTYFSFWVWHMCYETLSWELCCPLHPTRPMGVAVKIKVCIKFLLILKASLKRKIKFHTLPVYISDKRHYNHFFNNKKEKKITTHNNNTRLNLFFLPKAHPLYFLTNFFIWSQNVYTISPFILLCHSTRVFGIIISLIILIMNLDPPPP